MCRQASLPLSAPTLRQRIEKLSASASALRKSGFRLSTEVEAFCAFVALLVLLSLQSSTAFASCAADNPVGGTTTCSGDPATFPNGGASAQGGNTTLDVNGLTGNRQRLFNFANSPRRAPSVKVLDLKAGLG